MTGDGARVTRRGFLGMGVAAAGVITLTACGSQSGGTAGKSGPLTMTVWGGDSDRVAYQKRLDQLVAKYPELSVKLQLIPNDSYAQKVQTMIAGSNGPDIMEVAENVNVYASKNQLLPLDDRVKAAGLDLQGSFGSVGSIYTYKDKVYAIPDRSGAMIVYYNKALFQKAGLKPPTADSTWDDMLAAFKALTVPGKQWGYAGAGWWPQWWSLAYQNGGKIVDPSTGKPAVNSPRGRRGVAVGRRPDDQARRGPHQEAVRRHGRGRRRRPGLRQRQGRRQHHRILGRLGPAQEQHRLGHRADVAGQAAGGERLRQRPGDLPHREEPRRGLQGDRLPHLGRRRRRASSTRARTSRPASRCRRATASSSRAG